MDILKLPFILILSKICLINPTNYKIYRNYSGGNWYYFKVKGYLPNSHKYIWSTVFLDKKDYFVFIKEEYWLTVYFNLGGFINLKNILL